VTIKEFREGDWAGVDYDMQDFRMFMDDLEKVLEEMLKESVESNDDNLHYWYSKLYGVPDEELF
jgi:hypothetical protein